MDAVELREVQAPIKAQYREDPDSAVITLKAEGTIGEGVSCSVDTGRALGACWFSIVFTRFPLHIRLCPTGGQ